MKYKNIREEELKNKVGADWFKQFDTTEILGNIDFTVFPKNDSLFGRTPLLWAEAKTGNFDVPTMFVQLILTIGKARTFDKTLPPAFLGAFDFKKIAFVEYSNVQDIFYLNDFNWNVTPSNHETKEFRLIKERIESTLKENTYVFDFEKDDKELRIFIKDNIANATTTSKIKIDKNNFIPIYLRWVETVKPIIDVNWDDLKKANILDSDFYLADLFVDDNDTQNIEDDKTIRDSLFVVFHNQGYKIAKENLKQMFDATINIKDKDIYSQFWKLYKRPPLKEFQDYIIERRDLLTPQDIRERKGAFFTPRIWVELSQKYLTDYLGENWQDDYTIWDCAAGTGNLLAGLTNKYNIYASTLDQADVNVMHERIEHGANLLKNHVFQFDFLNDDFTKLPQSLQDIINDEEKRKKLVVYINPPYAEAASYGIESIPQVANETKIFNKYKSEIGSEALNELFAQFLIRINKEIPNSVLGYFSTPKFVTSEKFKKFRNKFNAKFHSGFICPSYTFDNVNGKFPIGFYVFNLNENKFLYNIKVDVYDLSKSNIIYKNIKSFYSTIDTTIAKWRATFYNDFLDPIGYMIIVGPSMQSNNNTFITSKARESYIKKGMVAKIVTTNIIEMSVYLSVRHCLEVNWLNNKDQFLYPNNGLESDTEFQNDCLAFTLFHSQNKVSISEKSINHWIPFTEQEVNAQNKFESHFMTDFINGKIKVEEETVLFGSASSPNQKREFSVEAKAVFDAGRELWSYYHKQPNVNVNASLYDIREYFQGRNEKGRMNSKSNDAHYMQLIGELRNQLNFLADKIKPKIYEYEFLKE
ncbi:Modification methylase HindII [Planktothrix rubescens]|nr:Modification methylase HindII [Planktothrix rubescens]